MGSAHVAGRNCGLTQNSQCGHSLRMGTLVSNYQITITAGAPGASTFTHSSSFTLTVIQRKSFIATAEGLVSQP